MKLTGGAIECLKRGAAKGTDEINAVGDDGESYDAGQVCAIADGVIRRQMGYNEFQPNLMVKEVVWSGAVKRDGELKWWVVTDCEDSSTHMHMLPTHRTKEANRSFMKKWGASGKNCKLAKGRRFTLVTCTTEIHPGAPVFDIETPVIRVEGIRMEPRSNFQKNLLSFFSKNVKEGDSRA